MTAFSEAVKAQFLALPHLHEPLESVRLKVFTLPTIHNFLLFSVLHFQSALFDRSQPWFFVFHEAQSVRLLL